MKKIATLLIIVGLSITAYSQGGWQPTPTNPNKWYLINKDTTIKGVTVNQFAVCITSVIVSYQEFRLDSLGQMIGNPHHTIIWFSEYFNKEAREDGLEEINKLKDFYLEFNGLPFIGLGVGDIGIAPIVKQKLAEYYNVDISQITE